MSSGQLVFFIILYIVAARACLLWAPERIRIPAFALINILGIWSLLYPISNFFAPLNIAIFLTYVMLVAAHYFLLTRFADCEGRFPWLAFFAPIGALILHKYLAPALGLLLIHKNLSSLERYYFIGISYLSFRASLLVLEVRNGSAKKPGFWEYLGFCFFLPTMSVGPINSYSNFARGFTGADRAQMPLGRSALRVLVGWVKFMYLAHPFNQLAYTNLMLDGHPHHWGDLVVSATAYYLFLYLNFSGFCDIAIGASGLLGFPVEENFNNPLSARNLQEFWNRWHITLSRYMRNVVFTPLSKWLVRVFGAAYANAAIAVSVFLVFLLLGIWHGVGWNYAAFGAANGLGLVIVHYHGIWMNKWLGREGYKRYLKNPFIKASSTALTFSYVAACLFIFANDFPTMRKILSVIT
jgi:D-alanyl-lipoteichoic acid acyltransferase DltB (MBOAT superfamily)